MYIVFCYFAYLALSVAATVLVARTLQRNGRSFLVDAFGNYELADSVNRLLVVGFYLVNIGFITRALRTDAQVSSAREAVELVSDKFGLALVVLGVLHFFNLYVFSRIRKRTQDRLHIEQRPPLPADAQMEF
jgi:hypothetical protein